MPNLKRKDGFMKFVCILSGVIGLSILAIAFAFYNLDNILDLGRFKFLFELYFLEITSGLVFISISIFIYYKYLEKSKTKIAKVFDFCVFIGLSVVWTYIVFCFEIYLVQDELISTNSILFQRQVITGEYAARIMKENKNVKEIVLATPDKKELHGWLVRKSLAKKSPLIIYFGGCAEEVSDLISYVENINGWSVLLMNYRGYGLSKGIPNEENLFKDALYIYDHFCRRLDIDKEHIVVMGYSRGTAVATYLSKERQVKGTILIAPPDKISSLFNRFFPYLPFDLILKQRFDSIGIAPMINSPLLCLVGDKDQDVPLELSVKLAESWEGRSKIKIIRGATHGSLFSFDSIWENINVFLDEIK